MTTSVHRACLCCLYCFSFVLVCIYIVTKVLEFHQFCFLSLFLHYVISAKTFVYFFCLRLRANLFYAIISLKTIIPAHRGVILTHIVCQSSFPDYYYYYYYYYYYEWIFLQDKSFAFIQAYTSKKAAFNTCPASVINHELIVISILIKLFLIVLFKWLYIFGVCKYIRRINKTNTSKQLLVSCLHIHQAYNMWDIEHTFHLIYRY